MTIAELAAQIPKFDWKGFIIDGVFKDVKNVTVDETELVIIEDFEFLQFIADLYNITETKHESARFSQRSLSFFVLKLKIILLSYLGKKKF